ncbi:DUF3592 domain-containing protein [Zavarzinia aquatilis]|uniref:DUF3592 domain-containing protein n=1 Tax=Zavarzinia aquatilis TaxID=2211142 RepID=A0A317EBM5_9PROT|nr:DUF3592 domain-containing protein [Zavarzinia aquatilis]PWR22733.1 hypothetical protein DKG74_09855 [Zavarzinia aquatilis]
MDHAAMSPLGRIASPLVLAAAGIAGAWATTASFERASVLWQEPDWPAATAEVLDITEDAAAGFRLHVRFMPRGHGPVDAVTRDPIGEAQVAILREAAQKTAGGKPTALVYYRPDQPRDVRVGGHERGARAMAAGFGALGLLLAVLSILALGRAGGAAVSLAESRPSGNIAPGSKSPR